MVGDWTARPIGGGELPEILGEVFGKEEDEYLDGLLSDVSSDVDGLDSYFGSEWGL